MYVYMYICIHVDMYICTYVYMHICIYVYMYICIYIQIYIPVFTQTTPAPTNNRPYTHMYTHTYTPIHKPPIHHSHPHPPKNSFNHPTSQTHQSTPASVFHLNFFLAFSIPTRREIHLCRTKNVSA